LGRLTRCFRVSSERLGKFWTSLMKGHKRLVSQCSSFSADANSNDFYLICSGESLTYKYLNF
jgi:hypothetical protein